MWGKLYTSVGFALLHAQSSAAGGVLAGVLTEYLVGMGTGPDPIQDEAQQSQAALQDTAAPDPALRL